MRGRGLPDPWVARNDRLPSSRVPAPPAARHRGAGPDILPSRGGADGSGAKALCAQAGEISRELTEISGMKLRHPVPCDFISKEKVNEFLKKRVKEAASPEDIRAEELTLKKFGLVPPDFDLAKTPWICSPNRPPRSTTTTGRSCSSPSHALRDAGAGAGARAVARPGGPELPPGEVTSARAARATMAPPPAWP